MDCVLHPSGLDVSFSPARRPREEPPSMPRRILIVEDHDLTRCDSQRLLQEDPQVQVDAAAEGEEALRFWP